jgi:hypothetical protein
MDSQPDQQETSELELKVARLEAQLSETLNAEEFFSSGSGQIITQLFVAEITRLTRDVTSDKYRKDLAGYNTALSDLLAYKNILKRLQLAASPERRARIEEQLGGMVEANKNAGQ